MGLTSWKNAPEGKILKPDVTIGKNYLSEEEISELNIVVNMYLDYAELQAKKQVAMKMADWLKDSGKISKKLADNKAGRVIRPDEGLVKAATEGHEIEGTDHKKIDQLKDQDQALLYYASKSESNQEVVSSLKTEKNKKPVHAKPQLYAHYFISLQSVAKEFGYNLIVHGSMNRDLDLIAVPCTEYQNLFLGVDFHT